LQRQLQEQAAKLKHSESAFLQVKEGLDRQILELAARHSETEEASRRDHEELDRQLEEALTELEKSESALHEIKEERDQARRELELARQQAQAASDVAQAECKRLAKELKDVRQDADDLAKEADAEHDRLLKEIAGLKRKKEEKQSEAVAELHRQLAAQADLLAKAAAHEQTLAALQNQLDRSTQEVSALQAQLSPLRLEVEQRARAEADWQAQKMSLEQRLAERAGAGTEHVQRVEQLLAERQGVETALHNEREHLLALVQSCPAGLLAFDGDFRCTQWNRAMERLTGRSRDGALGQSILEVFPELREGSRLSDALVSLANRSIRAAIPADSPLAAGAQRWMEGRFAPVCGSEGKVLGGMAIVLPVRQRQATAIKELERPAALRRGPGSPAGNGNGNGHHDLDNGHESPREDNRVLYHEMDWLAYN
jgi:PAS domain S-box-containing protein